MEWIKIFPSVEEARQRVGPGKTQLLIVNGQRLCLARYEDRFFVVSNRCPHNGASLSDGTINYLGEVVCPLHGYRFNLRTGFCAGGADDVETYPVRADDEGLFIAR